MCASSATTDTCVKFNENVESLLLSIVENSIVQVVFRRHTENAFHCACHGNLINSIHIFFVHFSADTPIDAFITVKMSEREGVRRQLSMNTENVSKLIKSSCSFQLDFLRHDSEHFIIMRCQQRV